MGGFFHGYVSHNQRVHHLPMADFPSTMVYLLKMVIFHHFLLPNRPGHQAGPKSHGLCAGHRRHRYSLCVELDAAHLQKDLEDLEAFIRWRKMLHKLTWDFKSTILIYFQLIELDNNWYHFRLKVPFYHFQLKKTLAFNMKTVPANAEIHISIWRGGFQETRHAQHKPSPSHHHFYI